MGSQKPTKLRKNITPGSGLLLVTGPFAVNGVPLRRVNQRFCIATSTKVAGGDAKAITDAFFARDGKKKDKSSESGFFANAKAAKDPLSDKKKTQQKDVDKALKVDGDMKSYLKARFSLSCNMHPHNLKF